MAADGKVHVNLPLDLWDRVKRGADARVISPNLLVTWAITEYLDRHPLSDYIRPHLGDGGEG